MPTLFRFLYTLASISLLIPVYALNHRIPIATLLGIKTSIDWPNWISYTLLFVLPFFCTYLLLLFKKHLQMQALHVESIKEIESAGADQIPVALGYVFIALSINNGTTLLCCLALLAILCFYTPTYFNIALYVYGYQYYYVKTRDDVRVLVATRKRVLLNEKVPFEELRRINDLTYIDIDND